MKQGGCLNDTFIKVKREGSRYDEKLFSKEAVSRLRVRIYVCGTSLMDNANRAHCCR